MALAGELRAGAVMVNDAISYFGIAEAPHGGCGASGWGRTHGQAGLLEMVQTNILMSDGLPEARSPGGTVMDWIWSAQRMDFCNLNFPAVSARNCATPAAP